MTKPEFEMLDLLLAAKAADATHVRFRPDGSIDVMFGEKKATREGRSNKNAGGVHEVKKTRADGTVATYWYAYRGGPRISEEEARRICDAARNKVIPIHRPVIE